MRANEEEKQMEMSHWVSEMVFDRNQKPVIELTARGPGSTDQSA